MALGENIKSGDQFARSAKQQATAFGHTVQTASMCSNHVLSESQCLHKEAVQVVLDSHRYDVSMPGPHPTFKNPFAAFCHAFDGEALQDLATVWNEFDDEGRQPYVDAFHRHPWQNPRTSGASGSRKSKDLWDRVQINASMLPCGLGNNRYPLTEENLADTNVETASEEFVTLFGDAIGMGTGFINAPVEYLCCHTCGHDRCQADYCSEQFGALASNKHLLRALAFKAASLPKEDFSANSYAYSRIVKHFVS